MNDPAGHDEHQSEPQRKRSKTFIEEVGSGLWSDAKAGIRMTFICIVIGAALGGAFGLVKGLGAASLLPAAIGAVLGLVFALAVLLSPIDF